MCTNGTQIHNTEKVDTVLHNAQNVGVMLYCVAKVCLIMLHSDGNVDFVMLYGVEKENRPMSCDSVKVDAMEEYDNTAL